MSGFGYQPKPLNLMTGKLTLSPETQAIIAEIEARMAFREWMARMDTPDWTQLRPDFHALVLKPQPIAPLQPAWLAPWPLQPASAQPDPATDQTPHPGDVGDLVGALYQLPVVQLQVKAMQDEVHRQLRVLKLEWGKAPVGEKVAMISLSAVVAAGIVTPILAVRDTRVMAFDLIKDKWLPVPGLEGYKIKLLDAGGGVTIPLPVRGMTVEAESQFLNAGAKPTTVMLQFDVMEFLSKPKK